MSLVGDTLRGLGDALHAMANAVDRLADLHDQLESVAERPALSVDQTAALLHVSKDTVRRRILAGDLPSFTVGSQRRIPYHAVAELMAGKVS